METLARWPRAWLIGPLLAIGLAVFWQAQPPAWLTAMESRWFMQVWRWFPIQTTERRVVLVDIDEKTLQTIGAWPWSSERLAHLSQRLQAAGASVQVFDVVFPPPRDFASLRAVWSKQQTVLSQIFALLPNQKMRQGSPAGALMQPCPPRIWTAYGVLANGADLGDFSTGHITPLLNPEGSVAQLPALVCYQGKAYPALGLQALSALASVTSQATLWQLKSGDGWFSAPQQLVFPALGLSVPLDEQAQVRLSYRLSPEHLLSVSAQDVLQGNIPAQVLQGAVVIIGSSALSIGDAVSTLQAPRVSGMTLHAQFMTAALDKTLPFTPPAVIALSVLWGIALLIGLLFAWRIQRWQIWLWVGVLWQTSLLVCAGYLLLTYHWWWSWGNVAVAGGVLTTLLGLAGWAKSDQFSQRLLAHLSSYLPTPLAMRLATQGPSAQVIARQQVVSVWFADIRNFTAFCSVYSPRAAAEVLHQFFQLSSDIVARYGGVVEAFQGDAIMAVWDAHTPCDKAPQQALAAAQALLAAIPDLQWDQLIQAPEPLSVTIGLESGEALVGSFGAQLRRTHTVLGMPVTVAWRLQGLTGELASSLLVGSEIYAQLSPVEQSQCVCLGQFLLEGLSQPQVVYAWQPQVLHA